jgi:hypothetical protein
MKMKTLLPVMSMVIVVISDNDDDDYEEDFGQSHRQIYNIYIYLLLTVMSPVAHHPAYPWWQLQVSIW